MNIREKNSELTHEVSIEITKRIIRKETALKKQKRNAIMPVSSRMPNGYD